MEPARHPIVPWLVLTCLSGCSIALTGPRADRPSDEAPRCDTGKGVVGLDGLAGTALAIGSLGLFAGDESAGGAVVGLAAVAFIAAAVRGNTTVNECRAAFAAYEPEASPRQRRRLATTPDPTGSGSTTVTPPVTTPYDEPPVDPASVFTRPHAVIAPATPPPAPAPEPATARPATRRTPEPATDWDDFWVEVP